MDPDPLPEADDIVERFERFIFDFDMDDYNAFEGNDEEEGALVEAMKNSDVQSVDKILTAFSQNPAKASFKIDGTPILLLAVVEGDMDVIKCMIDHHCDIRDADWSGNTAMHMAVWNRRTPYFYHERWSRNAPTCKGCDLKLHRLDIVEFLLQSYGDDKVSAFENVFVDTNKNGVTPFVRACAAGCDAIILRFLTILDRLRPKFLTTEVFGDAQGNNVFHYLLDSSTYHMTTSRVDTLKALLEKLALSKLMLQERNCTGITPLEILARPSVPDWPQIPQLIQLVLQYGADPDFLTIDGNTFLCMAIKNEGLVEILLRAGCDPNLCGRAGFTPLSLAVNRHRKEQTRPSITVIELLLTFGAKLDTELYLFAPEERPEDWTEKASLCDSSNIEPDILQELINVRKSGVLRTLKRTCRTSIRYFLKPMADERIQTLSCLPESLRSYLMVRNEQPLMKARHKSTMSPRI